MARALLLGGVRLARRAKLKRKSFAGQALRPLVAVSFREFEDAIKKKHWPSSQHFRQGLNRSK